MVLRRSDVWGLLGCSCESSHFKSFCIKSLFDTATSCFPFTPSFAIRSLPIFRLDISRAWRHSFIAQIARQRTTRIPIDDGGGGNRVAFMSSVGFYFLLSIWHQYRCQIVCDRCGVTSVPMQVSQGGPHEGSGMIRLNPLMLSASSQHLNSGLLTHYPPFRTKLDTPIRPMSSLYA